ncbi:MAG: hypothetical protein JO190_12725 [Candidatus Eremiobacteraeota bacterium]|nr:hypothetical protein [Candidatus Eremiobacteraeota bacterium]
MNPVVKALCAVTIAAALASCGKAIAPGPPALGGAGASNAASPDLVPRREQFPPTPAGVHLNLVFNYRVANLRREIGVVDLVWGARSPYPLRVVNEFYTPFERDGPDGPSHGLRWWKRNHPDWIEYRCNRKEVAFEFGERRDVPFDIANPEVLAYQRSSAVDPALAAGYRGIDFDNLELGNYFHRCGHYAGRKWVQQYSGRNGDPRYTRDVLTWAKDTFAYVHAHSKTATMSINFSYDSNFGADQNEALSLNADEVLAEAGFTNYGARGHNVTTPREWRRIVGLIRAIQAHKGCFMENGEEPSLSKDISQAERLWVVANYLLIRDDCSYMWISGFTPSGGQDYGRIFIYPEYALAVGRPTDGAQPVGEAWERDYSGGLALVNPSYRRVTIPLRGRYVDENGRRYTGSVTLDRTAGQILLKR